MIDCWTILMINLQGTYIPIGLTILDEILNEDYGQYSTYFAFNQGIYELIIINPYKFICCSSTFSWPK